MDVFANFLQMRKPEGKRRYSVISTKVSPHTLKQTVVSETCLLLKLIVALGGIVGLLLIGVEAHAQVNPNATQETKNVLNYIRSLEGTGKILSGQMEAGNNMTAQMDKIKTKTGKFPAIVGFDIVWDGDDIIATAIDSWNNRRQLITISSHLGAPPLADTFENSKKGYNGLIEKVLTPGTVEHNSFVSKLDTIAARLQTLENNKVPVLWRPLHEMNGEWFWWSKSGCNNYTRLWKFMYNYLTDIKGLNNLIWVWSAWHEPGNPCWHPGHQYVDINGSDVYLDVVSRDYTHLEVVFDVHKTRNPYKPVAITENNLIPNPDELKNRNINFVWFLTWFGAWLAENTDSELNSVYNHPLTITADEMPNLKAVVQ